MAIDRNRLEQEALALMNKGQLDKALNRFQLLLRADPRDRRVKQRVAELSARLGRNADAERLLKEVAESLVSDGQPRAALGVWKQLLDLRPGDPEVLGALGTAYHAAGFATDARRHYEEALRGLSRTSPAAAVPIAMALVRLAPGELALQAQVAELLQAAGRTDEALDQWKTLAEESRRRGAANDQARFLEAAMRLGGDDLGMLLAAAEARQSIGDHKGALPLLARARALDPQNSALLSNLARATEGAGQAPQARALWLEVAATLGEEGEPLARAEALERALACGPEDAQIRALLGQANQDAARFRLRLDDKPWAQARTDEELRVIVRARVLARYGLADRAEATLAGSGPAVRTSVAVRVSLAELYAEQGRTEDALAELTAVPPPVSLEAREQLQTRIDVLGGPVDLVDELEPEALEELSMDDLHAMNKVPIEALQPDESLFEEESIQDDPTEDDDAAPGGRDPNLDTQVRPPSSRAPVSRAPRSRGLRVGLKRSGPESKPAVAALTEEGPPTPVTPPPLAASVRVSPPMRPHILASAPAQDSVGLFPDPTNPFLGKPPDDVDDDLTDPGGAILGELRRPDQEPHGFDGQAFFDDPALQPDFSGLLASQGPRIEIEDSDEHEPVPRRDDDLQRARAHRMVGQVEVVRSLIGQREDLPARILLAQACWDVGDPVEAGRVLRTGLSAASETDPHYTEALWLLARLCALTDKRRAAMRLLGELQDLDPNFRLEEVGDLRRGLDLLADR